MPNTAEDMTPGGQSQGNAKYIRSKLPLLKIT